MVKKFVVAFVIAAAGLYTSALIGRSRFEGAKREYKAAKYSVHCDTNDSCIVGKFNKKELSTRYIGAIENKHYVPFYSCPEYRIITKDPAAERVAKKAKLRVIKAAE